MATIPSHVGDAERESGYLSAIGVRKVRFYVNTDGQTSSMHKICPEKQRFPS